MLKFSRSNPVPSAFVKSAATITGRISAPGRIGHCLPRSGLEIERECTQTQDPPFEWSILRLLVILRPRHTRRHENDQEQNLGQSCMSEAVQHHAVCSSLLSGDFLDSKRLHLPLLYSFTPPLPLSHLQRGTLLRNTTEKPQNVAADRH